jgi:hypothetical protein
MALFLVLEDFAGDLGNGVSIVTAGTLLDDTVFNVPAIRNQGCPLIAFIPSMVIPLAQFQAQGPKLPQTIASDGNLLALLLAASAINLPFTSVITWGNDSVAGTTTTRFLSPWFENAMAQTVTIQWAIPRDGIIKRMRVVHNVPAGNGNLIVYTLRVNGINTALAASVASTAASGSNLVSAVAVVGGNLLDIAVTKALSITTSPADVMVSVEFA